MIEEDIKAAIENGFVNKKDIVVITAGVLISRPGSTNFINIREIE
jgi:pyruvate kinase